MVSIVVPAHNEARVIGRLLGDLLAVARPGEFDIIVVPNGCTDETEQVAASFGAPVRVIASPEPSKAAALRLGDEAAQSFPRLYVDADVELRTEDVRELVAALREPGVLAAAPDRHLELTASSWPIRWYYQIWTRLPEVQRGLFGRGVIAVTREGHQRLERLPQVIADDLASSLAFAPEERVIVASARVVVHPPRTWGDLIRRRIRAVTGVEQLERTDLDQAGGSARTSMRDLAGMARREPHLVPPLVVFIGVALIAKARAAKAVRRNDYSAWQRDESSRA